MTVTVLAAVLAVSLLANPPQDKRIVTDDGVSFQMPSRFHVERDGDEFFTARSGVSASRKVMVAFSPSKIVECPEGAPGATVRDGRTMRGFETCKISAGAPQGGIAIILVATPSATTLITATGSSEEDALSLADLVAETIEYAPPPPSATERRVVGCYTSGSISGSGSTTTKRCFLPGGTVREKFWASFERRGIATGVVMGPTTAIAKSGWETATWRVRRDVLEITSDDGVSRDRIRFTDSGGMFACRVGDDCSEEDDDDESFWGRVSDVDDFEE